MLLKLPNILYTRASIISFILVCSSRVLCLVLLCSEISRIWFHYDGNSAQYTFTRETDEFSKNMNSENFQDNSPPILPYANLQDKCFFSYIIENPKIPPQNRRLKNTQLRYVYLELFNYFHTSLIPVLEPHYNNLLCKEEQIHHRTISALSKHTGDDHKSTSLYSELLEQLGNAIDMG